MAFPIISKVIDAITNVIMGYIIDHTKTKQGKGKTLSLLAAVLLPITGILLLQYQSSMKHWKLSGLCSHTICFIR